MKDKKVKTKSENKDDSIKEFIGLSGNVYFNADFFEEDGILFRMHYDGSGKKYFVDFSKDNDLEYIERNGIKYYFDKNTVVIEEDL
jgi:hypothetical protein